MGTKSVDSGGLAVHSGEGRQTIGSECVYFLLGSVCADAASALGRSNQLGIALGFVLSLSRSLPPSFSLSLFLSLPLSLSSSPYLSLAFRVFRFAAVLRWSTRNH